MKDIISKRRKELGLTQKELADKLFISDKVISKWETGKSIPDTAILVDLAKALDLSLDELLNVKDKKEDSNDSSLKGMLKAKYNNISIITFSIELISTLMFWTGNGIYEEAIQGSDNVLMILFFITMLVSIVLLVGSIAYYLVCSNGIKAKYARFLKLDNFYFNLFVIVSAVFINLDALCIVYYKGFYGSELFLSCLITTVIVASIAALIIWLKHFINKKR